jgi:hypothetical protein
LQVCQIFPISPKTFAIGLNFQNFPKNISQNCWNFPQKKTVEAILPQAHRIQGEAILESRMSVTCK